MAEKGKNSDHKNISLDDFLKYRSGESTDQEKHAFEKRLLEDDFAREAMEGFEDSTPTDIRDDLLSLKKQVSERTSSKKSINLYWRIAASFLFLLSASFVVYFLLKTNIDPSEHTTLETEKQVPDSTLVAQDFKLLEEETSPIPTEPEEESTQNIMPDQKRIVKEEPVAEIVESYEDGEESKSDLRIDLEEMITEEAETPPNEVELAMKDSDLDQTDELQGPELDQSGQISQDRQRVPARTERAKRRTREREEKARVALVPSVVQPSTANASGFSAGIISGVVISADDGTPLPGVNVVVKGTQMGAVTDVDGQFNVDVSQQPEPLLVISGIGYVSQEISAAEIEGNVIQLTPDITSLSEVVVVSYEAKSDLTPEHVPPKPVGGHNAFKDYIHDNLQYPETLMEEEVKGIVRMSVVISRAGRIENIEILKSPGIEFEQEAIRLLKEGPSWEPANENGNPVDEEIIIRIRFKRPEE